MTQYLVAIHHPDDYDPSLEDAAMVDDIRALNREMVEAGIRVFVGGLGPAHKAKTLFLGGNGEIVATDGPYIESREHVGGFWVLDLTSEADALDWGRKAAMACRAPVEVRAFN